MNQLGSQTKPAPSGFTLVEILTVIVIIGILAGIAIPAINGALRTSKETAIRVEIDVMSQAMEAYKLEYGDYPPDFSDWAAVERHFRKAFPNIDNGELRILAQFTHYNSGLLRTSSTGPADPRTSAAFDHYPHAIDRAEALVFCLGGFSKDKKFPFTGQGGPLVLVTGADAAGEPSGNGDDYLFYQYNSERETGFFDFDVTNLSLALHEPNGTSFSGPLAPALASLAAVPYVYTVDEDFAATGGIGPFNTNLVSIHYYADPFPTYNPPGSALPIVYFNSNGYLRAWGAPGGSVWNPSPANPLSAHEQNMYLPSGAPTTIAESGVARPYVTNVVDTTPPSTISGIPVAGPVLQFAEDSKFQLVSAGLDDNYGGIVAPTWGSTSAGIGVYPGGQYYNPFASFSPAGKYSTVASVEKFQDDECLKVHYGGGASVYSAQPQLDNITNFTSRTLEADLP